LIVGVDLDGVLADQVADVLPRIKQRLGVALTYEDITEFRLPLGSTDLAREIEAAQTDASYLLNMPLHEGVADAVRELQRHYQVVLITARPLSLRETTAMWLRANGFSFDGIVNAEETKKSMFGADVLIDDYTANIEEFVERTNGLGVLISRRWNQQDRTRLTPWIDAGRVVIADTLRDALDPIAAFARRKRKSEHSSATV
jgi:5'(3')-deoxyribonucleotidase